MSHPCCLADFQFEDLEVMYPKMRLEEEGATIVVCGSHDPRTKYTGKYGYPLLSNEQIDAAWIGCYQCGVAMEKIDAVIVPGGFAPDYMRRNQWMLDLVGRACNSSLLPSWTGCWWWPAFTP